jgi:DNA-binding transcriptional MerR regulator
LLPYADRDRARRRDCDDSIFAWIEFLGRLKTTGMPTREMLRYAALREEGAGTEIEGRELERHRERVRAYLAELNACLLVLDTKIGGYTPMEETLTDDDGKHLERRLSPAGARQARAR